MTESSSASVLVGLVGYLAVVLAIGFWAARRAGGLGDYFLGGRKMHRWVVALSAVVSGRSAWLIIGLTGIAYKRGASAVWAVVGYIAIEAALFWWYGRRLRVFAQQHDCITLPDFYAARLKDPHGHLRLLLVAIILVFMVTYVAAQFVAGGKAFAASFGMSTNSGVFLTAAIVLVYTAVGGFVAVSLTDVLQAVVMLVGLVVLPIAVVVHVGGVGPVLDTLRALDPTLVDPGALGFGAFVGFLGIGLGSPGNPHILTRYMSIAEPDQLRTAAIVGTGWNILMAAGALTIGLAGRAAIPEASGLPGGDVEQLYPHLAQAHLPPLLFGLVLAAVFAAIMSTADSQLLVAASSVVRDVYQQVFKKGAELDERRLVVISRLVVLALVALAIGLGLMATDLVFWLVLFAWAGLGAAIGPTSILALFWPGTTRAGVMAGLVAGAGTAFVWRYVPALKSMVYELIPAFAAGLVVTVVVSLLTADISRR